MKSPHVSCLLDRSAEGPRFGAEAQTILARAPRSPMIAGATSSALTGWRGSGCEGERRCNSEAV